MHELIWSVTTVAQEIRIRTGRGEADGPGAATVDMKMKVKIGRQSLHTLQETL